MLIPSPNPRLPAPASNRAPSGSPASSRRFRAALLAGLAFAAVVCGAAPARAQGTYPSRPITLVVPFATASGSDILARLLAKDMSEALGASVVVENRPGANGAIGSQLVARAKPDGYTLLIGSATTNATNYFFYPSKLGYGPADFDVVSGLGSSPQVLWVAESYRGRRLADLIADAKARPGKLTCGAGNAVTQVACELLKKQAGIDMTTVSYKANGLAVADVASDQITVAFSDGGAAMPYVEQRRVRPMAVAQAKRWPFLKDVPTLREEGIPNMEITAWGAVFAPAHTPPDVLAKLNAAVRRANASEAAAESRRRTGGADIWMPVEEARRFVAAEIERWSEYVRTTGVKPE